MGTLDYLLAVKPWLVVLSSVLNGKEQAKVEAILAETERRIGLEDGGSAARKSGSSNSKPAAPVRSAAGG